MTNALNAPINNKKKLYNHRPGPFLKQHLELLSLGNIQKGALLVAVNTAVSYLSVWRARMFLFSD
jgi:hypothetical protein